MNIEFFLHKGERIDDLQRNNLKIIQHPDKFCFGMDAVLLSAFVSLKKNAKVLDLGTGTGIIPILLSARWDTAHIDALEIQEESANMASRSVSMNELDQRIAIHQGDIKEATNLFPRDSFDAITTNPPYMTNHHGLKNPELPMAIARHEVLCNLEDIMSQSYHLLKPGGHFFMVHRPSRLAEIIAVMKKYRIEPKRIRFVHPYLHKEPNMVLIEGTRDGKPQTTIEPPLIVYDKEQNYTQELLDIYYS